MAGYVPGGSSAAVGTAIKNASAKPKPAPKPASKPAKPTPVKKAPPLTQQQYINQSVNRLGQPLTDAQIQASAQNTLAPLIKQITDSIGQQAQSGSQAIGGYTSELAHQLGGFQQNAANIYGGAQQSQAASDAALSAKLSGEGGAQAQQLGSQLASINAPGATNAAVTDATQTASGAGNALYATGSASLANLIASGAAEQSYASKLPGIADLSGIQQAGQLRSVLAKSLADQTGALQGKVPDIVAGLQGDRQTLRGNREQLRQNLRAAYASEATKQQALKQERQALNLPDASLSRAYGYAVDKNGNPIGGQATPLPGYHVGAGGNIVKDVKPTKPRKGAKGSTGQKPSVTLSERYGYIVDSYGHPILDAKGHKQKLPAVKKKASSSPFDVSPAGG